MSGNVLGTHIKQDMEIEAQLEMQRDRRALQAQQQAADAAARAAVSPRRTPVSNLNLREYSQMENSNSQLERARQAFATTEGQFYGLFEEMGEAVLNCRAGCNKKYSGLVDRYQRDACLAGCNMSVPGIEAETATVLGPRGSETTISSCRALEDKGPQYCKSWTQTDCCSHLGPEVTGGGGAWIGHAGAYVPAGNNVIPMQQGVSITAAKATCRNTPSCKAITYVTESPGNGIWFKDTAAIDCGSAAASWTTDTLGPAVPGSTCAEKKGTQGLAAKVADDCNTPIPAGVSGWCTCSDGSKTGIVDCGHPVFNCNEACAPASKKPYTYDQAPKDCALTDRYPYLVACGQKGNCYDGLKDETYTTYFEEGEACPANRVVAGTTYFLRQSGRSDYCDAAEYTVPFCPDPQYDSFPTRLPKTGTACSAPNTRQSCIQTAHPGWRPDTSLCKTKNANYVQQPCFVDPIRSWEPAPATCKTYRAGASSGSKLVCYRQSDAACIPAPVVDGVHKCLTGDTLVNNPGKGSAAAPGHVYTTFNSVPGLNIYATDVAKIRESPALYFYTVPPPKGANNETFYADAITSMTKDGNGTLYIHTQMNPGNGKAGPVKIPAQYADCFDGAAVLYIGPKPGTPEQPPPPTYWPPAGGARYIYHSKDDATAGCKKAGYDRLCSMAEVTSMGGMCAAGYVADGSPDPAGYYCPEGACGYPEGGCGPVKAGWRGWNPASPAGAYCCDGPAPAPAPPPKCKNMDGRYAFGNPERYTGGWALRNGLGNAPECEALCTGQPECKVAGQTCKTTTYGPSAGNRCYCSFCVPHSASFPQTCKNMDGRYGYGNADRYTGGWALGAAAAAPQCETLCSGQPECKVSGQTCKSTYYSDGNRCYCSFCVTK